MITAGLVVAACSSNEVSIGGPIDLQISSNAPVTQGDTLRLGYEAVGRSLLGMVVTWGDASLDSVFMNGAQSASGTASHLYADTGSFTITARLVDQVDGTDVKELTIRVDP
ncbi:MAG: hypothetical protein AMS19_09620 [Gemmatimonas sp. SG8_23]|jgi:hypothetical protein|nr:MAG: hypothetical protein AMS19_09620 [Gemmatimonas sp. SG8_23]